MAENKLKAAFEAEEKYMAAEAKHIEVKLRGPGKDFDP